MDQAGATVTHNMDESRFEVDLGDGLAMAEYRMSQGGIMFTHTEVPPEHEGRGIGTILVKAGLAEARKQGLKVLPVCRFFASYLQKHPEEQDLVHPSFRARLGLASPEAE